MTVVSTTSTRRRLLGAAALTIVALALGGCATTSTAMPAVATATNPAPSSPTSTTPTSPTSTTPTSPSTPAPAAGTVVLDTDLASADGRASIHLRVVATGQDDYVVQTSAYRSTLGEPLAVFFRQFDEQVGDTISEGVSFGYDAWGAPGETAQVPDARFRLQEAGDDPSFLRTAVLVNRPETSPWQVLGVSELHWSTPDRHPDLHVVDTGPRSGATGTVESAGGVPRWYHVAAGDRLADVATRFGVTVSDLHYLSARQALGLAYELQAGETLNLDRTKR
ncbi:LysM peptidoglycan-binding domain-containing protein [Curtobacterium sp. PhB136]|uniref:LysM peptidoglycan-binding domain-containing protein n=1 Tax=Curtobacterium sp. PhB136 TaxID=2485181 RepID=UPI0010510320|nr:LysM peptidoglycan-binding domain-containing protein [Curtobacterium sp. PhB136]